MAREKSAGGRIHQQRNSTNTKSYYDDAGAKVKKNEKGSLIKKKK